MADKQYAMDPDYNEVPVRIREFYEACPDGRLRPADPENPFKIIEIGDKTFIEYTALAFRSVDDPNPSVGVAWEPFPGKTPYTRDSELMNAETSAWGRAIVATGLSKAKRVSSANEVRNRSEDAKAEDASAEKIAAIKPEIVALGVALSMTPDELDTAFREANGGRTVSQASSAGVRGLQALQTFKAKLEADVATKAAEKASSGDVDDQKAALAALEAGGVKATPLTDTEAASATNTSDPS